MLIKGTVVTLILVLIILFLSGYDPQPFSVLKPVQKTLRTFDPNQPRRGFFFRTDLLSRLIMRAPLQSSSS